MGDGARAILHPLSSILRVFHDEQESLERALDRVAALHPVSAQHAAIWAR